LSDKRDNRNHPRKRRATSYERGSGLIRSFPALPFFCLREFIAMQRRLRACVLEILPQNAKRHKYKAATRRVYTRIYTSAEKHGAVSLKERMILNRIHDARSCVCIVNKNTCHKDSRALTFHRELNIPRDNGGEKISVGVFYDKTGAEL